MKKVELQKIVSSHNNLRTNTVVGYVKSIPEVGESLTLLSDSLTPGMDARMIQTTPIIDKLDIEGLITLKTHNSTYELKELSCE